MTDVQGAGDPGPLNPGPILELGMGFWGAKTLLSAVELRLFGLLAEGPLTLEELTERLDLHPRGRRDFFDALVALGMLQREDGRYANTPTTDAFLDPAKPGYVGGILEMANVRLYPFWGSLTQALHTGEPQNEMAQGEDPFAAIYSDEDRVRLFAQAMTGSALGAAMAIAERFPFDRYKTFFDVGCAEGALPVQVALRHSHIEGAGFDLPPVRGAFEEYVAGFGLADRLRFEAGDFWGDPLPKADVLSMGRILHDWDRDQKAELLAKAYAALPEGGALIVHDWLIDDDRSQNAFGLLMSLNMLIETPGGFDYTGTECREWMQAAGFSDTSVEHLAGPDWMVVGIK